MVKARSARNLWLAKNLHGRATTGIVSKMKDHHTRNEKKSQDGQPLRASSASGSNFPKMRLRARSSRRWMLPQAEKAQLARAVLVVLFVVVLSLAFGKERLLFTSNRRLQRNQGAQINSKMQRVYIDANKSTTLIVSEIAGMGLVSCVTVRMGLPLFVLSEERTKSYQAVTTHQQSPICITTRSRE